MNGCQDNKKSECVQNAKVPIGIKQRKCSVEGCERKYHAKGYCGRHLAQIYYYDKILERTKFDLNEYRFEEDVCYIQLYDRSGDPKYVAIIDQDDYKKVKNYKWYLNKQGMVFNKTLNSLSRFIMNATNRNLDVDHKNHNRLDNRKENLRICTRSQNSANTRIRSNNTSGYKGVSWNTTAKKWVANIWSHNKCIYLGYFKEKEEAAMIYDKAAIKYHGEFACLNFPQMAQSIRTAAKKMVKEKSNEN